MYYLANNNNADFKGYDNANNFYLCPAQEYYNDGAVSTESNDTPFLTTYRTRQTEESLWIVEKVTAAGYTNYYTFKQIAGDHFRYLTVNGEISGGYKSHRRRVHLEEFTHEPLSDRNYFSIVPIENATKDGVIGYSIGCLDKYKPSGTSNQYLNPPSGNQNSYTSFANKETPQSGGIVGFYTKGTSDGDGRGSVWFFEVPKPIMHIDGNNTLSFTCVDEDVTYRCTIDSDTDPTVSDTKFTTTELAEGVHTIKVIAVNANNHASGVVTYQTRVFSTEHPYLISNNQNPWTVGGENQYIYYMIPSDVDVENNNTTVNTTSMPRPSMEWYVDYAGEVDGTRYFNFRNAKTDGYLYRTDNNIYMKTSSEKTTLEEGDDNGFKFYLIERTDGYSIVPYGETSKYLNKNNGNNKAAVVALGTNNNDYSKWNFVVKADLTNDLNSTPPFTASDENTSVFYKIKNAQKTDGNDFFVIPPTTTEYATASKDAAESSMSWYFVQVQASNDDDWLTYFKIVSAETGDALFYSYTNDNTNCLKTGTYNGSNDNYKFAFVKSPTTDYYHIVPKSLINDQKLANIYTFYRNNSNIRPATTRDADNNAWTFTPASLFCNNPEFVEEEGSIKIKCNTNAAEIRYPTNGDDPKADGVTYNTYPPAESLSASDKLVIKAYAIVSDGTNIASSADVVTLLNKPDVTLAAGPYTYKGTAWEPSVTSVSVDETIAPISPATYTVNYGNNLDAGTAQVTITDADPADTWYLWNVPETEFTIDRKAVTITAKGASKEYDGTELTESDFTHSDLEVGDPHAFTVVMTTESTITDAGTQSNVIAKVDDIEMITGTEKAVGNYLVTTINGTLEITKASVTVTADNQTKGYDDPDPTLTATIVGLKNGEAEDKITYSISRTEGENKGDYTITPAGDTDQGNYTVSYITGTLTITTKALGNGTAPAEGIDITITYDGSSYQITVKQGNKTLVEGESNDYTWTGTGTDSYVVTVTGHGNYANSAQATYIKHDFFDTTPDDLSLTETAAVYYATQDMQVSDEFDAYYVTKLENNELTIAKVEVDENENKISYIPANQPVLLLSKEGGTSKPLGFTLKPYTGTQVTFPAEGEEGANLLKVVTDEGGKSVALTEVYIFSVGEFVLSMAGTMSKGKFYLENPAYNTSSPARKVVRIRKRAATSIDNDEITGIDSQSMDSWYTIDGRRLSSKPTKKGLYIKRSEKGKSGSVTVIK